MHRRTRPQTDRPTFTRAQLAELSALADAVTPGANQEAPAVVAMLDFGHRFLGNRIITEWHAYFNSHRDGWYCPDVPWTIGAVRRRIADTTTSFARLGAPHCGR